MFNISCTAYSTTSLSFLKSDLGFFGSDLDFELESYLCGLTVTASKELATVCKIHLEPEDVHDDQLVAMYAAWLYRKRASGEGKPPMLQTAIRNRQVRRAVKPQDRRRRHDL